jgi:hypothetical protein
MIHDVSFAYEPDSQDCTIQGIHDLVFQIVPSSLDPVITPIPPAICAILLGITLEEHDMLLATGLLEQSCLVSPFGGRGQFGPLLMSNYWDLLRAALILKLSLSGAELTITCDLLSSVIDEVARSVECDGQSSYITLSDLIFACQDLELQARGLALLAVFTIREFPCRFLTAETQAAQGNPPANRTVPAPV